ncbi:MAG: deaminase [Ignavibacteriae bacterium]|nr:deaminase [Ignavibacteriota bacterium]
MMEQRAITDAKTIGPYSPAQQVGNFLFVSGQIALNSETGKLETADIETETKQALHNLMNILKSAGYDSSDVVSTTVYLKDINDFAKMNAVYAKHFQEGNYPTRATVQVAALPKDARIEISAIAYKSTSK